jgi:hypothetical protein
MCLRSPGRRPSAFYDILNDSYDVTEEKTSSSLCRPAMVVSGSSSPSSFLVPTSIHTLTILLVGNPATAREHDLSLVHLFDHVLSFMSRCSSDVDSEFSIV